MGKVLKIGCLSFILFIGLIWLLGGVLGIGNDEEVTKEVVEEQPEEVEEEPEEVEPEEIRHNDRFEFGDFTIKNIRTITDDELTIKFEWVNQSGKDKIPFTAVGYVDVEGLEETSNAYTSKNSSALRKVGNGLSAIVTLTYDITDEPITITFGAISEDTKETITIEGTQ